MRFWTLVWRSVRLRCPLCGRGKLFRGWFQMHEACSGCGADLRRESGFYLGSIYVNYGLTSLVIAVAYPLLLFNGVLPEAWLLGIALTFVILFPICFFRHARALWIGFDQFMDPRDGETGTGQDKADKPPDDS